MILITDTVAGIGLAIRETVPVQYDNVARISKIATLDGGVSVAHYGTTDLDMPLTVKCRLNQADNETLLGIFRRAALVILSLPFGLYQAYIFRVQPGGITFYLKAKLA